MVPFTYRAKTEVEWGSLTTILESMGYVACHFPFESIDFESRPWFLTNRKGDHKSFWVNGDSLKTYKVVDNFADFVALAVGTATPPEDPEIFRTTFFKEGDVVKINYTCYTFDAIRQVYEHMQALQEHHRDTKED